MNEGMISLFFLYSIFASRLSHFFSPFDFVVVWDFITLAGIKGVTEIPDVGSELFNTPPKQKPITAAAAAPTLFQ